MRHIIKPLLRHRLMPLLVALQVALACAIACNALFLLQQKLVPILSPDGIGQPQNLIVASHIASRGKPWSTGRLEEVGAALRAITAVTSVSVAGSIPMETMAQMNGDVVAADSNRTTDAAIYIGENLVATLDLKLLAGRDFSAIEQTTHYAGTGINQSGPTIISQDLAERLFPQGDALGKVIRLGHDVDAGRRTVVGIVAHLMRNKLGQDNRTDIDDSMVFPGIPGQWPVPLFGVRVAQASDVKRVTASMKAVIQHELGNSMITGIDPQYDRYETLRNTMMAKSKAAVCLLSGVSLAVLIVALVGIMGLTSYWVQQRTRQIGVRRALGARRDHILRDVLLENLLVVGIGIAAGMGLAYLVNFWLMRHFELSRLPWIYLPLGAALMLFLGQVAVLAPALRASRVSPVVATRAV